MECSSAEKGSLFIFGINFRSLKVIFAKKQWSKIGAVAEKVRDRCKQVRSRRGAGAEQARSRRGAGAEQARSRCGAGAEQARKVES
jgi:hypothetical protein